MTSGNDTPNVLCLKAHARTDKVHVFVIDIYWTIDHQLANKLKKNKGEQNKTHTQTNEQTNKQTENKDADNKQPTKHCRVSFLRGILKDQLWGGKCVDRVLSEPR